MAALWATDTVVIANAFGGVTALPSGSSLYPGQSVVSPNGVFRLQFQTDGNVVLLQLPDIVLWATATDGTDASLLAMQTDGNLVLYGSMVLFASATDGSPGAYLALQNDGNLVIYEFESAEKLAVWSLRPNWQAGSIETLEWLTTVTESPMAVEQRMGIRASPRQMIEYSYTLVGPARSYLDFLTMATAGSPVYVPLWHDVSHLTAVGIAGYDVLALDTQYTEFENCRYAALVHPERRMEQVPLTYELVEIASYTASSLTLRAGLAADWPVGTWVVPIKKFRIETQPQAARRADRAFEARVRFQSLEPNPSTASPTLGIYLDYFVLEEDTDEVDLSVRYDRKQFMLDNETSIPSLYDVGGFTHQDFAWFAHGRERQWRMRGLFYALQGRRVPIWLPSGMIDFEMTVPLGDNDTTLTVRRCGYTEMGGPQKHREHIVIQLYDGTRLYRQIVAAAIGGDNVTEQLALNIPTGRLIQPRDVKRISFLTLSRLDQDSIELHHPTDSRGMTVANAVFRTDPGLGGALRSALPGVFFTVVDSSTTLLPMHRAVYVDATSMGYMPSPPSGGVNSPIGMCSVWIRHALSGAGFGTMFNSPSTIAIVRVGGMSILNIGFSPNASGSSPVPYFYVSFFNTLGNQGMRCQTTADLPEWVATGTDIDWHSIIVTWDISVLGSPVVTIWLDRVSYTCPVYLPSVPGGGMVNTVEYASATTAYVLGDPGTGVKGLIGLGAELWLAPGQWLDMTSSSNLDKFTDGTHAVELGADGSTPTGTAPWLYFGGPAQNGIPGYQDVASNELFTANRGGAGGTISSFTSGGGGGIQTVENLVIPILTPPTITYVPVLPTFDPFP